MDNKISKMEYDKFVKDKQLFFEDVISKTINSIQEKYLLEIILQNEVKLSINSLLSIAKDLKHADNIEKLQLINNSLSSIIKQYGTNCFSNLINICYENNKKCNDFNKDKYSILINHFKPINYKILNFNDIKKSAIGKNDKIINSSNLDCIEILSNNDNFYLKVYGITIIIHDDNKYIIIDGYVDNLPGEIINNKYINTKLYNITNNKTTESYQLYLNSLSIKDLLIYDENTIINNYNGLISKVKLLNKSPVVKVIRDYLINDSFYQRNITISLLLDNTNQYSQYLAYLLFDMLSDENNKQYDSKNQMEFLIIHLNIV